MTNISPRTEDAYQLFHKGILALTRAELQGIRIDIEYVEKKKNFLTRKISKLEEQFKSTSFFKHWQHTVKGSVNINSNIQLANFIYKIKKVKIEKETASGQGATDEDSLKQMNIPELNNLLEMRKLKKVRDTYLGSITREQVNGYIHPFFNLHIPVTYRSSSDHPNFQNIPIRDEESMQIVRRAIFPRPGHQLLEIDFKGIEVAVSACYNKDSNLLKYVSDPKTDMHRDMAKQIFKLSNYDKDLPEHYVLRQAAKNGFVFPQFYGDYYKNCTVNVLCNWGKLPQGKFHSGEGIAMPNGTLADHLIDVGLGSYNLFENHLQKIEADFWGNRFAEYAEWKERWWRVYQKYGYITLLTGFTCGGVMNKKEVCNYPVQGSAFHCLLWSFIELDRIMRKEKWDSRLIGQIHDSAILDVNPDELNHIVKTAQRVACEDLPNKWKWIITPLNIDLAICPVDAPWSQKEKFEI